MARLLHNMQQPDSKTAQSVRYWAEAGRGVGCFVIGNKSAELCAGLLVHFVVSPEDSVLSPAQVLSFIEANICQPFTMLRNLGKRLIGYTESRADDELEIVSYTDSPDIPIWEPCHESLGRDQWENRGYFLCTFPQTFYMDLE
ncbi:hypothetical protein R3P38DRAFT_3193507 [Favolaschia claudopus]|uniref:Uncharacterized protein n=1 Tax=Favolaschia claudopus TaxID=2862362 RepID=A0AAW0BHL4_9AGAR